MTFHQTDIISERNTCYPRERENSLEGNPILVVNGDSEDGFECAEDIRRWFYLGGEDDVHLPVVVELSL